MQLSDLEQFTGTEKYYRVGFGSLTLLLTDGCFYVAEQGKAFWLFDLILSYQIYREVREQFVQVWQLTKQSNDEWLATCEDWNGKLVKKQEIPYSDFPLDTIKILVKEGVCLLPSED